MADDVPGRAGTRVDTERNIFEVAHRVTAAERAERFGQRGAVLWLTGYSGSGKSTIALELERRLFDQAQAVYLLDGDNVRLGLNRDLGFRPEDRTENIRRVGEVAALMADAGLITIAAFISPYRSDRLMARQAAQRQRSSFHEIFVSADLATCEARDPKGLYRQARSGAIADFTGVSAPYEPPEDPELVIDTQRLSIDEAVALAYEYVRHELLAGSKIPSLQP